MQGGITEDETILSKMSVKIAQTIANLFWRTSFTDICYGMFAINRKKYLGLEIKSTGFDIEWEMMIKAARRGLKILEIPSREKRRIHGKSNISYVRDGLAIARAVLKNI